MVQKIGCSVEKFLFGRLLVAVGPEVGRGSSGVHERQSQGLTPAGLNDEIMKVPSLNYAYNMQHI